MMHNWQAIGNNTIECVAVTAPLDGNSPPWTGCPGCGIKLGVSVVEAIRRKGEDPDDAADRAVEEAYGG